MWIFTFFQFGKGIKKTEVGYIGGKMEKPNYQLVTRGDTGHAEALQISFDPVCWFCSCCSSCRSSSCSCQHFQFPLILLLNLEANVVRAAVQVLLQDSRKLYDYLILFI